MKYDNEVAAFHGALGFFQLSPLQYNINLSRWQSTVALHWCDAPEHLTARSAFKDFILLAPTWGGELLEQTLRFCCRRGIVFHVRCLYTLGKGTRSPGKAPECPLFIAGLNRRRVLCSSYGSRFFGSTLEKEKHAVDKEKMESREPAETWSWLPQHRKSLTPNKSQSR